MNPARRLYRFLLSSAVGALNLAGLNVAKSRDYYSPLPLRGELWRHRERWDRPSELVGVGYDLDAMRSLLLELTDFMPAYRELPPYDDAKAHGYGPGFTVVDALLVYLMIRHLRPQRYIEIGSGLSTFYAWRAASDNALDGHPCQLLAIDPYSSAQVRELDGLEILDEPVQSADLALFEQLGDSDVLFIDSTHVVRIDGDVPRLYLEIVPRLAPGVVVHSHDIHFPYNTPYPAEQYIKNAKWPYYWTEAMLLQAFLAFNSDFEILLSPALLRHHDEGFLEHELPDYQPVEVTNHDTHAGSIWYRRRP